MIGGWRGAQCGGPAERVLEGNHREGRGMGAQGSGFWRWWAVGGGAVQAMGCLMRAVRRPLGPCVMPCSSSLGTGHA